MILSLKIGLSFSSRKSNKAKKVAIIRKDENLLQQASKYYNISLVSITCNATDEIILLFLYLFKS